MIHKAWRHQQRRRTCKTGCLSRQITLLKLVLRRGRFKLTRVNVRFHCSYMPQIRDDSSDQQARPASRK
jgi:hypothetical protein